MKALLLLLILTMTCAEVQKTYASPIEVGVSTWPPYLEANEKGYAFDKLAKIMQHLNIEYKVSYYPFKRLLWMSMNNEIQLAAVLTKTEARKTKLMFSEPLFCDRRFIYSHQLKKENGLYDSKNQTLGVGLGINYGEHFNEEAAKLGISIQKFPSPTVLIAALNEKRVENILISEREAEYVTDSMKDFSLKPHTKSPVPLSKMELYLVLPISENSQRLLNKINAAILALNLREACA